VKTLLRLYPRAWQARYGDELLALLADRPASPLDLLDLVRGAFDARLHPQLAGTAAERTERSVPMFDRLPGLTAIAGGIAIIIAVALMALQPVVVGDDYRDTTLSLIIWGPALVAIDVALIVAGTWRRPAGPWARADSLLGVLAIVAGFIWFTGWPGIIIGLFTLIAVTIAAVVRYLMAVAAPAWVVAGSIIAGLMAYASNTEDSRVWLLAPIGLMAIVVGLGIALRPSHRAPAITADGSAT
jgi:hypothetical protein